MKHKRIVLFFLAILVTGVIVFAVHVMQKNSAHRADFSGEWQAKESISMGGNIVCCYDAGDRMLAKTMKITEQADYLMVVAASSFPGTPPVKGREKLSFDGKEREKQINNSQQWKKKFAVKLSPNGQTITVNSIVYKMVPKPYHVDVQEQLVVHVIEVWKLSDDGKSISIQANAKSNSFGKERSWKTVFYKVG